MKTHFLIITIVLFSVVILAQPDYSRSSLTLMAMDFNENHSNEVLSEFSEIKVPVKFYSNPVKDPVIDMGQVKRPVQAELPAFLQYVSDDFIIRMLNDKKIAQQILSQWFNRQDDGTFNVEVLKERGLYNANDNDFIVASASKRGTSTLMDMGLQLVNQSYVLVLDYYSIMTMDEYYAKEETDKKDRTSNGYKAKVKGYLFRLDFSEEVAADFFKNYWIDAQDPERENKIKAFDNAVFKWIPVGKQIAESTASQLNPENKLSSKQKSRTELIYELNTDILEKIQMQMEAVSDQLRVKAMVSSTRPISAKIGKKEGLNFDQRYFVYENRMRRDSSVQKKLIAVVKSMKVIDNRQVTEGHSEASEFYQIYGRRVDNMGMYMEQKNDFGLNLYVGNTFQGLRGINGRMEYYISKFMGDLIAKNKSGRFLTSLKMYVEGGYDRRLYEWSEDKQEFVKLSLGLEKEFYPVSLFHLAPFIGYGIESTSVTINDTKIDDETDIIEAGLRLGIHIFPRVQLVGSYQWNWLFGGKSKVEGMDEVLDLDYGADYPGRGNPSVSAGLRITL